MARLIPSFMDGQTPPGEREVFNMLANGPDDWVALHALDLAPWNRGVRTELDFVIIIPDTGILCVEVKSHEHLSFDGRQWYPSALKRSPFKQAVDGSYTFFRRLSSLAPELAHIPVVHLCIFPRASFHIGPNLSVQPWELIDGETFRGFHNGLAFCSELRARANRGIEANRALTAVPKSLTQYQVESIVSACVPIQTRQSAFRDEIRQREVEVERVLRDQQKPVLQLAALNERVIVTGSAGTGKTLIAIEVARRFAESGMRVGLLCFNQLIGDSIKHKIECSAPALPNLVAGRAIRVMAGLTGIQVPNNPDQTFWDNILPQTIEEQLTDPNFGDTVAFDCLVIDEAQDLLARPRLWECLIQFLRGGIENGKFILFGDFEHQVLVSRALVQESLLQVEQLSKPVRWKLSENCRNYRIVGETAALLSGMGPTVYTGYLRIGGGIHNYNISFYDDDQAQDEKLGQWLREFKAMGYSASDISLLSFRADEQSAAARLRAAGYKLRPARQQGDEISFATIHAYKGMENKIIILTDVCLDRHGFNRDLFYTGMTRSTDSVRVLCETQSQNTLAQWLSDKVGV